MAMPILDLLGAGGNRRLLRLHQTPDTSSAVSYRGPFTIRSILPIKIGGARIERLTWRRWHSMVLLGRWRRC